MKQKVIKTVFALCLSVGSASLLWSADKPVVQQEEQTVSEGSVQQELWVNNGERRIYGVLSRPENPQAKNPLVIIAHGFNGTHHFGRNYFDMLNGLGFFCYTFDFPCGSAKSMSDKNTMNMSVLDEQSDLVALIRYFKSRPDVDTSRIVLLGESQGGLVAGLVAADVQEDVSELVLIYPAFCIPDNWRSHYPRLEDIPDTTRLWKVPMGRRFFAEIHDMDVFSRIGHFRKPVIIIQGDADRIVPLEDSQRAVRIYEDARLHVIPGAGHGFRSAEFAESLEQIRLFLEGGK